MNGIRRLGFRCWRRTLLRTYRKWTARRALPEILRLVDRKCVRFGRKNKGDSPRYWWKGELEHLHKPAMEAEGRVLHSHQVGSLGRAVGVGSLTVAADGLTRAAGPYEQDHPQNL